LKARTRIITLAIMAVAFAGLIGWDIYAAANDTPGDTISELTLGFTQERQGVLVGVVWAIGLLCGHLFWPQWRDRR
jgi:hypothetical protein